MAFNSSLSGMRAANADLNVTSHNIANVNTTGFKESRAEFAEVFSTTGYGLLQNGIGAGVRVTNVAQQFSQGDINQTGRYLDLAVDREGFFTVSNNGTNVYTRAGNFQRDPDGYVTTPDGYRLQVFPPRADGIGFDTGNLVDLQLLTTDSAPAPTTNVDLGVTLPGNAAQPTITPFSPTDSASYNETTSVTVYDSLGVAHQQAVYYVKTANPNEWQMHTYVDGASMGAPTTVQFDNNGTLTAPANGLVTLAPFTPSTGAGVLNMTMNISGTTQYGEQFAKRIQNQDGYATGKLNEFSVSPEGVVFARYSNGVDRAIGQVGLANFTNPQGLVSQGNNTWTHSFASGEPRIGAPGTSDFGQVASGALEASTVDLTEQLVNMIVAQRNFQANSQMLSTQDQITQTVINIR
ncbi:flagellar hook protein FlgE [Pseudoxanthomonas sp. 3HH-4]|jgi:flagellar hook protein FlgE|uniref:flagellar hook protein FlgE n=1 Tax=Pseudoxanthomonas sp. 3HH-4 TaxID=1690214 RepID=UPI001151B97D|nr:flagellar hook protein FlgE [Pseudoxanthomonas sp. 3HH-4]TQM12427.1 flagellar hook protein FlgE [Pseudoxanthomonas sp. 3HH-4]